MLYLIIGAMADLILDSELLSFSWTRCNWLISWFVWFMWDRCELQGLNRINGRELFGLMRIMYKEAQNRDLLSAIPGLM